MFSGVLNGIPGPWNGILLALIVGISAIAAIFTVVKLGLVGVVDVDGDLYFRCLGFFQKIFCNIPFAFKLNI
jgi:hypothetical protein